LQPGYAQAHFNLGTAFFKKGLLDLAAEHFQKTTSLAPDYAKAYSHLGAVLVKQRKWDEGRTQLSRSLQLQPENAYARNELANLAWSLATSPDPQNRNGPRAVSVAEQLSRFDGGASPSTARILAAAFAECGRFPEATEAAERALRLARGQTNTTLAASLEQEVQLYAGGQPLRTNSPSP
jgi:Flp pilus assembly protein TadD